MVRTADRFRTQVEAAERNEYRAKGMQARFHDREVTAVPRARPDCQNAWIGGWHDADAIVTDPRRNPHA